MLHDVSCFMVTLRYFPSDFHWVCIWYLFSNTIFCYIFSHFIYSITDFYFLFISFLANIFHKQHECSKSCSFLSTYFIGWCPHIHDHLNSISSQEHFFSCSSFLLLFFFHIFSQFLLNFFVCIFFIRNLHYFCIIFLLQPKQSCKAIKSCIWYTLSYLNFRYCGLQ